MEWLSISLEYVYLDVPLSFPSNILCICNLCVIMLFCKAILKYLLYQLGTGGINEMK